MGNTMTYKLPHLPHGNLIDLTTQKITGATNAAYTVTFDTPNDMEGISLVDNSKITVGSPGDYEFIVSAVVDCTAGTALHCDLWFAKGGTNVANSNTRVELPNATTELIVSISFIIDLLVGEYIQLKWCADDNRVRLLSTAAAASPTRPACPSVVVAVKKISE
mgnify:CR=1 FL=1